MKNLNRAFISNNLALIIKLEQKGVDFTQKGSRYLRKISNHDNYLDEKYHYFHHQLFEYFLSQNKLFVNVLEKILTDIIMMETKNTQEIEYFFSHVSPSLFNDERILLTALHSDNSMVFNKICSYYPLNDQLIGVLLDEVLNNAHKKISLSILELAIEKNLFNPKSVNLSYVSKSNKAFILRLMELGVEVPLYQREHLFESFLNTRDSDLFYAWVKYYPLSEEEKQSCLYDFFQVSQVELFNFIRQDVQEIQHLPDYVQILKNWSNTMFENNLTLAHYPLAETIIAEFFEYDRKTFEYVEKNLPVYQPITMKYRIDDILLNKQAPKRKKI